MNERVGEGGSNDHAARADGSRTRGQRGDDYVAALSAAGTSAETAALSDAHRAMAHEILRKLVGRIADDIAAALPPGGADIDREAVWHRIGRIGGHGASLDRLLLARVIEHELGGAGDALELADLAPGPRFAEAWMAYLIADRRSRDGWGLPILAAGDIPLDMYADLADLVADTIRAIADDDAASIDALGAATAAAVSLHREARALSVAATRLVEVSRRTMSDDALIDRLIASGAWSAIFALIADAAATDSVSAAIECRVARPDALRAWLASNLSVGVANAIAGAIGVTVEPLDLIGDVGDLPEAEA